MPSLEKELFEALEKKNVRKVRELLDRGVDPNIQYEHGLTPLHIASGLGHPNLVKLLLKYGANPNVQNVAFPEIKIFGDIPLPKNDGYTPLHFAVQGGYAKIIKILVKHGANLNTVSNNGLSPLHLATILGKVKVVETLLKLGADPNIYKENKIAKSTRRDLTESFHGYTPLHLVILLSDTPHLRRSAVKIIKKLLKYGANPDILSDYGWLPLNTAILLENVKIIKILLKHGADPNKRDKNGCTSLHIAKILKRGNLVKILLKYGADDSIPDTECKNNLKKLKDEEIVLPCAFGIDL
ncbi:ankyrin repeat domain-containing protein [Sulfolobus tengchongensis]|uniref:Ankyrin repeat domain-containing protein n=1 Tax=Sulfolobus tengchongensis TaxID=207809 RepID=A0AAX4L126_9CREN